MGQCLGVDRIRQDVDRQKAELRKSVVEVDRLKKEIADLRTEIERSTKEIATKLDDWVLKSKKNEKERIIKEMENQTEIGDAIKDVTALKADLKKLQSEFGQYKKDNTTILVALDKALEKRMSLQRAASSEDLFVHPPSTEKLQHHHSFHSSSHHHHHHHSTKSNIDIDFPQSPTAPTPTTNNSDVESAVAPAGALSIVPTVAPIIDANQSSPGLEANSLADVGGSSKSSHKSKLVNAARAVQITSTLVRLDKEDKAMNAGKVPQLNLSTINKEVADESKSAVNDGQSLRKLYFTIAMTESGFGFVLRSLKSYQTAWFESLDKVKPTTRMCVKDWRVFADGKNPAELAGVRIGDIIEEVEGQTFTEINEMLTALKETASKSTVTIGLWRKE